MQLIASDTVWNIRAETKYIWTSGEARQVMAASSCCMLQPHTSYCVVLFNVFSNEQWLNAKGISELSLHQDAMLTRY